MAGSFRWTLPPTCEGGGFGASLDSTRPCTPQASSGRRSHLGQENILATGYQPLWVLLGRLTLRTETGTKPGAQSCPLSREQLEQETGGEDL